MMNFFKKFFYLFIFSFHVFFLYLPLHAEENFEEFEVRVIRPRFFSKKYRFELGVQTGVISNQSFIYTLLAGGNLTFHFSETFSLNLIYDYGVTENKADKDTLSNSDYRISTQLQRNKGAKTVAMDWAPLYGKYQLSSGKMIYFDSFISLGGGLSDVEYKYDYCLSGTRDGEKSKVVSYPSGMLGVGQRFFFSENQGFKYVLSTYLFNANSADGQCKEGQEGSSNLVQNIEFHLGYSYYF